MSLEELDLPEEVKDIISNCVMRGFDIKPEKVMIHVRVPRHKNALGQVMFSPDDDVYKLVWGIAGGELRFLYHEQGTIVPPIPEKIIFESDKGNFNHSDIRLL